MMEQLERQAEAISREFKAKKIANTLWAYATMERSRGGDDGGYNDGPRTSED